LIRGKIIQTIALKNTNDQCIVRGLRSTIIVKQFQHDLSNILIKLFNHVM